jgi:hypothetical protein
MVASTWITPGCVQFLKNKKRFNTAWTLSGLRAASVLVQRQKLLGSAE